MKTENQEILIKPVEITIKGEIDLPQLDIKPYIGKKVLIESANTFQGSYGYYVKVETARLDTVKYNGKVIEIRASRVFGLQIDSDGAIGWGKDTNLGRFLAKMKVKSFKDLVGLPVVVQTVTNKTDNRDYLSFN